MITARDLTSVDSKTKELLIYIANKLIDKPNYGATLLNKAFYFIDSVSYLKTGKPISSFSYVKQQFGPTPKPAQFLKLRDNLVESGDTTILKTERFGHPQIKIIPTRQSNVDAFSKEEIILIDNIIQNICDISATDISDFSHEFIAWKFARLSEEIPLNTYLLTTKQISENDKSWAESRIQHRRAVSHS